MNECEIHSMNNDITNIKSFCGERASSMFVMRLQKKTLSEIGAAFGISRSRVKQVILRSIRDSIRESEKLSRDGVSLSGNMYISNNEAGRMLDLIGHQKALT